MGTNPDNWDTDGDNLSDGEEVDTYHTLPLTPHTDGDGMPDGWEVFHQLDPLHNDAALDPDSDGLTNLEEYQNTADPHKADTDGDGLADGAEVHTYHTYPSIDDSDYDGLKDGQEVLIYHTSPTSRDTDTDGIKDSWEITNNLNPLQNDSALDPDSDGLNNLEEFLNETNPHIPDTDGDGLTDGVEIHYSWDPLNPKPLNPRDSDTDGDGLGDAQEVNVFHTNANKYDTDGDSLSDGFEVSHPTTLNPLVPNNPNADPDHDGQTNRDEQTFNSDPGNPDTDGDGKNDGAEITQGSNPNDPSDGGNPPPADQIISLTLKLGPGEYDGDQESNFQVYTMVVSEVGANKPLITFPCDPPINNYTAHTKTMTSKLFRRGKSYQVEIKAAQPDASSSKDFDYHAYVEAVAGGDMPYVIYDPNINNTYQGVLGSHEQDQNGSAPFPQRGKYATLLPVEFEVTEWEPVFNQSPPILDSNPYPIKMLVAGMCLTAENAFDLMAKVRMKPIPLPAAIADVVVQNWEAKMLQDIISYPEPYSRVYSKGTQTLILQTIPCADPSGDRSETGGFDKQPFKKATDVLELHHEDSPTLGAPLWINAKEPRTSLNFGNDYLLALHGKVEFITWVYVEHKTTHEKHFLKWVKWKTQFNVDAYNINISSPSFYNNEETSIDKIEEGDGEGPIKPSFAPLVRSENYQPKNSN